MSISWCRIFATGLAVVKLSVGAVAANPVLMEIDAPPPAIVRVTSPSGVSYDANRFASAGDVVNVVVTGLDPAVQGNLTA